MYQQRTLAFDAPEKREDEQLAQATSLPPPATATSATIPLVRPDRQLTYGGIPHDEWPAPDHDRDTITVDRVREDIDGPSHRFVIKRGDRVEVFLSRDRTDVGRVTGVSQHNQEVRVSFRKGSEGLWFDKGHIYPAVKEFLKPSKHGRSRSEIVAEVNLGHENGLTEADRVPPPLPTPSPYSFDDFKAFHRGMADCTVGFEQYQDEFRRLLDSIEPITAELKSRFNAKQLAILASRMGSWHARGNTKEQNAADVYQKMLSRFCWTTRFALPWARATKTPSRRRF